MKYVALNTFAGMRFIPVYVVGETIKGFRVRILQVGGATLPNGRYKEYGHTAWVPKSAVTDVMPGTQA